MGWLPELPEVRTCTATLGVVSSALHATTRNQWVTPPVSLNTFVCFVEPSSSTKAVNAQLFHWPYTFFSTRYQTSSDETDGGSHISIAESAVAARTLTFTGFPGGPVQWPINMPQCCRISREHTTERKTSEEENITEWTDLTLCNAVRLSQGRATWSKIVIKGKGEHYFCYSAPSRLCHHRGAQVHGAHQAASHIPALNLPSRSRYSFTDHLRMEDWVSPGPGSKEQLAHGCYATARGSGARTRISRSKVEHANH